MSITAGGNMGLGVLSQPGTYFKRKYRWSFALETPCGSVSENLVKISSRPQIDIEEQEINFLHGKMWIPGKASWQTMSVTYYDVVAGSNDVSVLYSWLKSIHEFDNSVNLRQSSVAGSGTKGANPKGWAAKAELYLYDGIGNAVETWQLGLVWPTSINFGDLDYQSSEELTIELTLRYSTVNFIPGSCMQKLEDCLPTGCDGKSTVPAA
jgi:hypothetical protein